MASYPTSSDMEEISHSMDHFRSARNGRSCRPFDKPLPVFSWPRHSESYIVQQIRCMAGFSTCALAQYPGHSLGRRVGHGEAGSDVP